MNRYLHKYNEFILYCFNKNKIVILTIRSILYIIFGINLRNIESCILFSKDTNELKFLEECSEESSLSF